MLLKFTDFNELLFYQIRFRLKQLNYKPKQTKAMKLAAVPIGCAGTFFFLSHSWNPRDEWPDIHGRADFPANK